MVPLTRYVPTGISQLSSCRLQLRLGLTGGKVKNSLLCGGTVAFLTTSIPGFHGVVDGFGAVLDMP
jgi:hypothetical protein